DRRAESMEAQDAGASGMEAHGASRRSEQVLHGIGGLSCQRTGKSVGRANRQEISRSASANRSRCERGQIADFGGMGAVAPARQQSAGRGSDPREGRGYAGRAA